MTHQAKEVVAVIDGGDQYSIYSDVLDEAKHQTQEGKLIECLGLVGLNTSVTRFRVENGIQIYDMYERSEKSQITSSL